MSGYAIAGSAPKTVELEFDPDSYLIYLGMAAPGSAIDAAVWQIRKFTYDGYHNITAILYADGNAAHRHAWVDRASLSYS